MKKLNIVISIILVMMLAITTSVTAFATDVNLDNEKWAMEQKVKDVEDYYVKHMYFDPLKIPEWSAASKQNLVDVIAKARAEIPYCETLEEINSYQVLLDEAVAGLCISARELQWMINYMRKDYNNSTNYYDEETYAELKTIYENAQKVLESGVEVDIHNAYIDMRNELNKLCAYNSVFLDVDNDGVFSIKDCTLMQMYIAKMVELTSSQRYVGLLYHDANIQDVTDAQQMLVGTYLVPYSPYKNTDFVALDPSVKEYLGETPGYEQSNDMYYHDKYCYLWYCVGYHGYYESY